MAGVGKGFGDYKLYTKAFFWLTLEVFSAVMEDAQEGYKPSKALAAFLPTTALVLDLTLSRKQ
jgi:hypothetical protein